MEANADLHLSLAVWSSANPHCVNCISQTTSQSTVQFQSSLPVSKSAQPWPIWTFPTLTLNASTSVKSQTLSWLHPHTTCSIWSGTLTSKSQTPKPRNSLKTSQSLKSVAFKKSVWLESSRNRTTVKSWKVFSPVSKSRSSYLSQPSQMTNLMSTMTARTSQFQMENQAIHLRKKRKVKNEKSIISLLLFKLVFYILFVFALTLIEVFRILSNVLHYFRHLLFVR